MYVVGEEDERLFDLHLTQIEKHTSVPYTLYAGVNRLAPKLRDQLAGRANVSICAMAPTSLRNAAEHSHYLEQLAHIAIQENATHIITLHTDSFPLTDDWVVNLAQPLSTKCVFSVIGYGPYTACLFFSSDYYSTFKPRFLLSDSELASEEYHRFSQRISHVNHSGIGFLFNAFCNGLNWNPLFETQKGSAMGSIYADMIFHLHGAARLTSPSNSPPRPDAARWLNHLRRALRTSVPKRARRWGWHHFGDTLVRLIDSHVVPYSKQQLLDAPSAYLEYLRTGKKQERIPRNES